VVKCYTYGEEEHKSWECHDKKREEFGESHIVEEQKHVEVEAAEGGRNLMMRKILLKLEKKPEEPVQ
jgi:hypothetical protein